MDKLDCFTIDISIQGSKPFVETGKKPVFQLPKSKWWNIIKPKVMQADPFLFVHNDTLFLFYEEMLFGSGLGVIKMVSTKDLKSWTKPALITHELECHFSYPYVFENNGSIYMLPETGCDHNIRLYKAVDDTLAKFEKTEVLIERPQNEWSDIVFDYADSCIHKKDGKYYLFTSYLKSDGKYYLELYYSDRLNGQYALHPCSPICIGNKYGRCGGSLIEADGRLFRPAQDCVNQYGGQMHILEIDELTPSSFKEHVVKDNVLPPVEMYKEGGHQINFAEFQGKTIVATDIKFHCSFFLYRILLKTLKMLHLKENKPY